MNGTGNMEDISAKSVPQYEVVSARGNVSSIRFNTAAGLLWTTQPNAGPTRQDRTAGKGLGYPDFRRRSSNRRLEAHGRTQEERWEQTENYCSSGTTLETRSSTNARHAFQLTGAIRLLTGKDAPRPPLDGSAVEQLCAAFQDRIRALKSA